MCQSTIGVLIPGTSGRSLWSSASALPDVETAGSTLHASFLHSCFLVLVSLGAALLPVHSVSRWCKTQCGPFQAPFTPDWALLFTRHSLANSHSAFTFLCRANHLLCGFVQNRFLPFTLFSLSGTELRPTTALLIAHERSGQYPRPACGNCSLRSS